MSVFPGQETKLSIDLEYGTFHATVYDRYINREVTPTTVGAVMVLGFQPKKFKLKGMLTGRVEFHLVQAVREVTGLGGNARQGNAGYLARVAPNGWAIDMDWQAKWDAGYQAIAAARRRELEDGEGDPYQWQLEVDRETERARLGGTVLTSLDPRYAQQRVSGMIPLFTTMTERTSGNALVLMPPQHAIPPGNNRATLRDNPSVPVDCNVTGMEFQVAVLLEYGEPAARQQRYLGSVSWGWFRTDGMGDVQLHQLQQVDPTGASQEFLAAVAHWNALRVADPAALRGQQHTVLPLPVN
jgi:hypothetical protein